jgi:hypothetical protein
MALNHLAVGAAVAGLAAARMQAWGSWPYVSLGAWLALSPLLWGYFSNLSIALSDLVAAAWIVLLGSRKIGNLTESKSE